MNITIRFWMEKNRMNWTTEKSCVRTYVTINLQINLHFLTVIIIFIFSGVHSFNEITVFFFLYLIFNQIKYKRKKTKKKQRYVRAIVLTILIYLLVRYVRLCNEKIKYFLRTVGKSWEISSTFFSNRVLACEFFSTQKR